MGPVPTFNLVLSIYYHWGILSSRTEIWSSLYSYLEIDIFGRGSKLSDEL